MSYLLTKEMLFDDCRLLFGPHIESSMDFLRNLPQSELKAIYRKRAFETHPDRAMALGEIESKLNDRFKKVILAYERLNYFIQNSKRTVLVSNGQTVQRNQKNNANQRKQECRKNARNITLDYFYKGYIPKRKLFIGQYLYYSGIISWNTLFDAICWQRKQRPLMGQIAMDWGILNEYEVKRILKGRNHNERFGEYAYRNGYITYFELLALRGRQLQFQQPIGKYFIQQRILCPREMEKMAKNLRLWNYEFSC